MYESDKTKWRFTVPQAGEVDSAETVEKRMVEIDEALIGPMNKAELVSQGASLVPQSFVDGDTSAYSNTPDEYWSTVEGRPIYTTKTHFHPVPASVLSSNHAASADYANTAGVATVARGLEPAITLNGVRLYGGVSGQTATMKISDIPDASRVFYGSNKPESAEIENPRKGDIYVQIL